jgi:hypothetical protein
VIGCLGRIPSREDLRTFKLSRYLEPRAYPAPPPARDWSGRTRYTWSLNDRIGCCTITGLVHLAQAHAAANGETITIEDADVLKAYSAISGYDGTPATDRGAQMIDALVHARREGIGGWKIGAFVRVDAHDYFELRAAINLFGGVYVGADLPRRIREQGDAWELPPINQREDDDAPNSLGGHAFAVLGYDRLQLHALPWITPTTIGNAWADLYVSEAWAFIDQRWVTGERPAPNGLDLERLRGDLAAIGAS